MKKILKHFNVHFEKDNKNGKSARSSSRDSIESENSSQTVVQAEETKTNIELKKEKLPSPNKDIFK